MTKVALDQSIAAPSLLAIFFSSMTLMEGKGIEDVKHKLKSVCMASRSPIVSDMLFFVVLLVYASDILGCVGARSDCQYGLCPA